MKTIINKPYALNEIGGRSNNEDTIYPPKGTATENDTLFLVCDGVGGNEKGEVASRLACESFSKYFQNSPVEISDEHYINSALTQTENLFDRYIEQYPESKGMATTLTLLHLHKKGATIAHIGDSRVYQFRNGEILFKTDDHSLVNELMKEGILTKEQADNHPRKNVITRAIQGAAVKTTKASVQIITDIRKGDYFFLCTDGILENITDFNIAQILNLNISDKEKIEKIKKQCEINPNDNFSAYMIPVGYVEDALANNEETVEAGVIDESNGETYVDERDISINEEDGNKDEKYKNNKPKKSFLYLLGIIVILLGLYMLSSNHKKEQKKVKIETFPHKPFGKQQNEKELTKPVKINTSVALGNDSNKNIKNKIRNNQISNKNDSIKRITSHKMKAGTQINDTTKPGKNLIQTNKDINNQNK